MNWDPTPSKTGVGRRSFLAAGAAGATLATSGCVGHVRNVVGKAVSGQLSLSIATIPADADRQSVQIARRLEANLQQVGIDVSIDMRSPSELLKAVLIERDFDLYVGHHPAGYDPDFLYEMLHSSFAAEAGWQNPFGFTNMVFDTLLEDQRRAEGEQRKRLVQSVLTALAKSKPFDPICLPDEYRVASTDRFDGWSEADLTTRHGYLEPEPADGVDELLALKTDSRPTSNLNPLSATMRERDTIIPLLFDSVATVHEGEVQQWLAEDITWTNVEPADSEQGPVLTATVTLREGCRFHADERLASEDEQLSDEDRRLTAEDVAFTYRFLEDTSLGRAPTPSPAPRYQSHVSAVDRVTVDSEYELTFSMNASRPVAKRALTVPILPKRFWRELVDERAADGEFTAPQGRWIAATGDHVPPIGSGPFQFESRTEEDQLVLTRFDDHFTLREDVELPGPPVDELRFEIDPSSASAVRRIGDGNADVTASMLDADVLDEIPDMSDIETLSHPSRTFYHIGFNVRNAPFSNTHFRHAVTQLIPKQAIVDDIFYGHATPTATPVLDEWVPERLAWDGEDPVTPFLGSSGRLNVEAAKAAFETAGFRYDDNGRLLGGY
ncbi:ABC transporter substrate-binding protein [Haloterrigena sp. H1]|uniref:ABC transporter substrate-binding protein n=1 Tax=Haloterrigena sp. H1 TaxID=2552943 RepID=UPI00110EE7CC|nr:ABC transporter substrate-binding protein [Haloterrigena sp. H1]TMT85989.1 ABC transporter substrate-binding protein [Haloterrigena sp. H1]